MKVLEWIKKHNGKNHPYCGQCYYGDGKRGIWGHCLICDKKRIKHEFY